MDKNKVKGSIEDAKGRIKRQAGEWTDNPKLQGEGMADQAKGKIQKFVGEVKDKARDSADDAEHRDEDIRHRRSA